MRESHISFAADVWHLPVLMRACGYFRFFCGYDGLISRFIFEIAREFAWVRSSRVYAYSLRITKSLVRGKSGRGKEA